MAEGDDEGGKTDPPPPPQNTIAITFLFLFIVIAMVLGAVVYLNRPQKVMMEEFLNS